MYFRTNIPFEAFKSIEHAMGGFFRNYMIDIPEFDGISDRDKRTILEQNTALVWNVGQSVWLGNHLVSERLYEFFQRVFDQPQNPLRQVLEELNLLQTWPKDNIEYKQVFTSPWAPHIDLEERDEELTRKISKWPLNSEQNRSSLPSTFTSYELTARWRCKEPLIDLIATLRFS